MEEPLRAFRRIDRLLVSGRSEYLLRPAHNGRLPNLTSKGICVVYYGILQVILEET